VRVLLVEPQYRRGLAKSGELMANVSSSKTALHRNDDNLWYPPIGIMKLSRFHKNRGDYVRFVSGCDKSAVVPPDRFNGTELWDRVYVSTLFTFHWKAIVETINFYRKEVGGTTGKIFVGGIMASIMPNDIFEETGVYPVRGVLTSSLSIGFPEDINIDLLAPDYDLLDPSLYATNETYYGYTSRGCVNSCPWCGVPSIEPQYIPYIDIKPTIRFLRETHGDKSRLKLMDNNVLASPRLDQIVEDLVDLGYGRGQYTESKRPKLRVVDFNQGLDASELTEDKMRLLARLNIKPMRIAFDKASEKPHYIKALELAKKYGVIEISNYMLYNWRDSPKDLYDRLMVNVHLNEQWGKSTAQKAECEVYSYPMRFAPICNTNGKHENRHRDDFVMDTTPHRDWLRSPVWTPRFVRNVEIMKGAAHGAISPTPSLAKRTIGRSFQEFLVNLYMPEELLRNRNKHERYVYKDEPPRKPGTGKVEAFRTFIIELLKAQDDRFLEFHNAATSNDITTLRRAISFCKDEDIKKWLKEYLNK